MYQIQVLDIKFGFKHNGVKQSNDYVYTAPDNAVVEDLKANFGLGEMLHKSCSVSFG